MGSEATPPFREAVWRRADARFGKAWANGPGRLRKGTVVTVTEFREGRMVAWVETSWGYSGLAFTHNLDFGMEFRTRKGEWLSESDPRAVRWLQRVRSEMKAGKPPRHFGDAGRTLELAEVERVLRRNGWSERRDVNLGPPWGGKRKA